MKKEKIFYCGFSLIEVLVSLFLLSFLLLGFDAIEISSLREERSAYFFSVATHQLHSIKERLCAASENPDIKKIMSVWNQENKMVLPEGKGKIEGNFPNYLLAISWGEMDWVRCKKIIIGESGCLFEKITVSR